MRIKKIMHTGLSLVFMIHMHGCVTTKAIEYAEELASQPTEYRKLLDIYPIAFQEKGDIELCVTLACDDEDCEKDSYTIILPVEALSSGKTNAKKMDLLLVLGADNHYFPLYWYPIEKPSKNCADDIAIEIQFGEEVYIENLSVPVDRWEYIHAGQLVNKYKMYEILEEYNEGNFLGGQVYALNTVMPEDPSTEELYLTYFPDKFNVPPVNVMGLKGGYHDPSTKSGYVLIPFALAADAAIVALVIAGFVVVLIGGVLYVLSQ